MAELSPAVKLSVEVDAICSRNRYTSEPGPVIDELRAATAHRPDVLAEAAGTWLGYFEDEYTATLCAALRSIPGVEPWIEVGRFRRSLPAPSTPEILGHGMAVDMPLYVTTDPVVLDAPGPPPSRRLA
ncbi:hypothetical protein ACFY9N_11990 [Microbacterium sp. NPDC008134]|jgi:hypothetical protein|uniref:hypothetical protein n=1 Tax=Microbacterium sp. NPDC008134 TaxID=3364183 RepID=UPI0036E4A1C7